MRRQILEFKLAKMVSGCFLDMMIFQMKRTGLKEAKVHVRGILRKSTSMSGLYKHNIDRMFNL